MSFFSWSPSKREEDGVLPVGGSSTTQQQQQQLRPSNAQTRADERPAVLEHPPTSSAYIHQPGEGLISATTPYHSHQMTSSERNDDVIDDSDNVEHAVIPTFSIFTPAKTEGDDSNQQDGWSEDGGWDINDSALQTSADVDTTIEQSQLDQNLDVREDDEVENQTVTTESVVRQEAGIARPSESSRAETTVSFADEQRAARKDSVEETSPSSSPTAPQHNTTSNPSTATNILASTDTLEEQQPPSLNADPTMSTALAKPFTNFVFLSEESSVPSQLNQLQETSMRRRHEFQSNVYELELRVAALTAALSRERMEREESLQNLLPDHVHRPLQECMEDLCLQRDEARNVDNSWMKLEGRLSVLDSHMTHSTHVDLEDAKLNQLDRLKDQLEQQVEPSMQLQSHKLDKREGTLFRKFEDLAGSMARKYQEERTTRMAATKVVSSQMTTMQDLDQALAKAYEDQCQSLLQQVRDEKEARQQQDVYMSRLVAKQEAIMKQALLEAVGSGVHGQDSE